MAARDIMPFVSPQGGTLEVRYGSMTASETFEVGEPVNIVNAGTITEPPDDVTQWIIGDGDNPDGTGWGIACYGPGASNIDPKTGVAFATGAEIAYWPGNQGTLFITDNFFAAGGGSAVVPLQTDVGESYQITYGTFGTPDAGWGVEQTAGVAGVDYQAIVTDVLDSQKAPIRLSGNAGVYVVFELVGATGAA